MVNGRILEDELKRIDDFFDSLSAEEFEVMAIECGAGVIVPSVESMYVEAIPKRYANRENDVAPLILPTVNVNKLLDKEKQD